MKKYILIGLALLVFFFVSCSPKTEYTNALPKDASVMVMIDMKAIIQKAGLEGDAGKDLSNKIAGLLKDGLEGETAKLMERIVHEPSESGLNLKDKLYLFTTPHANVYGVVAKVADKGKLEDLFEVLHKEQLTSTVKKEGSCQWTQIGNALCAFNNGTFLLLQHKSGDVENIKGMLFSLMRQKDGEGYASLSEFASLSKENKDIVSTVDASILPDEIITPLRMGLPGDIKLQDIKYLVSASFEKGHLLMDAHLMTQNKKVEAFIHKMNEITGLIQAKYMDYFPAKTTAWMGGRIHGGTFYDIICQNPTIRQFVNNPILPVDVERIFSSVEGDFGFGCLSMATKEFLMYVDVTNSNFLETFEDLRPLLAMTGGEVRLHDTAENQYALQTYNAVYWFGVKNHFFYVTNRRELAQEAGRTFGVSVGTRPWTNDVKNNRIHASINFSSLSADLKQNPYLLASLSNRQTISICQMLVNQCEYMNISIPDWSQSKLDIAMKDKKENVLSLMVQMVNGL